MDWKRQTTDLGANVLGELVAIGAGLLPGKEGSIKHLRNTLEQPPAHGYGQLLTLIHCHSAAGLAGQLGTYRILHLFQRL